MAFATRRERERKNERKKEIRALDPKSNSSLNTFASIVPSIFSVTSLDSERWKERGRRSKRDKREREKERMRELVM